VTDLLDISRLITGKIRIEPAQVDLANVVNLVVADAHFALEVKRIDLQLDHADAPTVMRGDGERPSTSNRCW